MRSDLTARVDHCSWLEELPVSPSFLVALDDFRASLDNVSSRMEALWLLVDARRSDKLLRALEAYEVQIAEIEKAVAELAQ